MTFSLHPNLKNKIYIDDLKLCRVLMEDNAELPWIFLVPRRENVRNMMELSDADRSQLSQEISLCEQVMTRLFKPDQTNVAAIGNVTPQLHVHIIARFKTDSMWPDVVWGCAGTPCTPAKKEQRVIAIQKEICICQK